jgi:hypothetical protein
MQNLRAREGPKRISIECDNRDCRTTRSREFNFSSFATAIKVDNGPNITSFEAMLGHGRLENNQIVFLHRRYLNFLPLDTL